MTANRFGINANRVDGANRFEIFAQPTSGGRRAPGIETVDKLSHLLGTQGIWAYWIALNGRPDIFKIAEFASNGEVIA